MFGFGENKKAKNNAIHHKQSNADSIPDDKFMVMPNQYRPKDNNKQRSKIRINKKFVLLGGGSLAVLLIFSTGLYFLFFSGQSNQAQQEDSLNHQQYSDSDAFGKDEDSQKEKEDKESARIEEKTIRAQAFDEKNALAGSLFITIPPTVVQEYGSGIGATVLEPEDTSLPEEVQIVGGLYSVYPSGITFEEPVSFEISFSSWPKGAEQADLYPAYLRGVRWQEFEDYQKTESGFSFMLEKFPSGSIAVVWDTSEDATTTADKFEYKETEPSLDTDGDGLTDKEENLIGTSSYVKDSDEDGYNDLEEIQNNYSPISPEGGLLSESGIFSEYTNETYGYKVSYPSSWLADSLDQSNKQVLFISETEEFFEILVQENPLNTPIVDWYRDQSPSLKSVDLDVMIIDSRPAVWSIDRLTLYTSKDGLIYIITYNKGTLNNINWPNMFEYFYKSFTFGNTNGSQEDSQIEYEVQEDTATSTLESME